MTATRHLLPWLPGYKPRGQAWHRAGTAGPLALRCFRSASRSSARSSAWRSFSSGLSFASLSLSLAGSFCTWKAPQGTARFNEATPPAWHPRNVLVWNHPAVFNLVAWVSGWWLHIPKLDCWIAFGWLISLRPKPSQPLVPFSGSNLSNVDPDQPLI